MAGFVKEYTNLAVNGAVGPQTLTAATTYTTNGVPCRGARGVVFRVKSTDANAPQSFTLNVGNAPLRTQIFLSPSAIGYTQRANAGVRMDQGNGNTVLLEPAQRFYHDFVQFNILTHATLTHTAFTVDAEVYYDEDSDAATKHYEQDNYSVPTS